MDKKNKSALKEFFLATERLAQLSIIRSRDYMGDISKYLCKVMYNLEGVESGEPAGYDGMIGASRIQVKINNCPRGIPVRLIEPLGFDELIVILGPNSLLRPKNIKDDFIFYRFHKEEVISKFKTPGGKYLGEKNTFSKGYDKLLRLTEY